MSDLKKLMLMQLSTVAIVVALFAGYERYVRPAPPVPAPERVEVAAKAWLKASPAILDSLAGEADAGKVSLATLPGRLKEAWAPASGEIAEAIKASPSLAAALRAAAKAQREALR